MNHHNVGRCRGALIYMHSEKMAVVPVEIGLNPLEMDQALWVLATVNDISLQKKPAWTLRTPYVKKERLLRVSQALFDSHLGMMRNALDGTQEIGGQSWVSNGTHSEIGLRLWQVGTPVNMHEGTVRQFQHPYLMQVVCIILPWSLAGALSVEVNEVDPPLAWGWGRYCRWRYSFAKCAATTVPPLAGSGRHSRLSVSNNCS